MSNRRSALWSIVIALVGLVFLAMPGRAMAQVLPGGIVGLVVDAKGTAVPGAQVVLRHEGVVVARALTNREGKFEFARLRPGRYLLVAEKPGVGRGLAPVAVKSGAISRVKVTLTRG